MPYSIVASKKTLEHLQGADPWAHYDPWRKDGPPAPASNASTTPSSSNSSVQQVTQAQIAALEANFDKKLQMNARPTDGDASMDPTGMEGRIAQLEHQFQQVQAMQIGTDARVGQLQTQIDQQSKQLGDRIEEKLTEQMDRIEQLLCKRAPGPVIGNMNPTGLMGKATEIAALPTGVYAFQESHLTVQGLRRFKQELAWCQSGYRICHGYPAPPKNDSVRTIGGRHTGTGVLSAFPCRAIDHHWTKEQFQSGRCQASAVFLQGRWLTMGTVYGYSERSHCLDVQQQTGSLLDGLSSRIVDGSHGLRFISGDWNQERHNVPQAEQWEAKGWMEAQAFAQWRWSTPAVATCRKTTVKDYVFLSPEVLPYVQDVQLDWTVFPDHAVIQVHLSDVGRPPLVPMWRKPAQIDWPDKPKQMPWETNIAPCEDTDMWYRQIWHDMETYASELNAAQGKPPLTVSQTGRGSTTAVKWTQEQTAPIKSNRHVDIQSALSTSSMQYSRWTKQVRRLQHYARCAAAPCSSTVAEHRACLWRKIRYATGFRGGFQVWWAHLPKQFYHTPLVLPHTPPDGEVAFAIFTEFTMHYKALETSLVHAKTMHAAQRRNQDPLQIYRDLQKERAEPVQTVVLEENYPVISKQHMEGDQMLLHLEKLIPAGIQSFAINDIATAVEVVDDQTLRVPQQVGEACHTGIQVHTIEADATKVLQAFEKEWAPRWLKAGHEEPEQWEAIVGFMQHAMSPRQAQFPPITPVVFLKAVAAKRKYAAIGPDGVSRRDILHMPANTLASLVELLHRIELGAKWPTQATTGIVAALAKTAGAKTDMEFYQSTPMPAPPDEHYPKVPLAKIAQHLGIPDQVMIPWNNALLSMTRRFQVRGAVGNALSSNRGYPEGCGLSVVIMVVANITAELWLYYRFPSIRLWSFVDNIEATAATAEEAINALSALGDFCALMDLSIDPCKTYAWSTTASGRKAILDSQFHKKLYARDLGGHMCYSKLRTNATVQDKIKEFSPFWFRLARSQAPFRQKERALYVCAWPNVFYGISTVTLGANHFQRLRSQCTRALNTNQTGANPDLQLSCICNPLADPELYSLLATVQAFRNHADLDLAQYALEHLASGGSASQGPCTSFLSAIHKVAWHWKSADMCIDQDGIPIHVMFCPKIELRQRLIQAWQQRVLATTEEIRTTMKGMSQADVQLTQKCFRSLPEDHQGLMRCALNGTQYTNDALSHAGVVDTADCRFCGHRDSLFHRTWECLFFQHLRDSMPELPKSDAITMCTACHGWLPRAPQLTELTATFLEVPDQTAKFDNVQISCELRFIDLFLDGSCLPPSDPTTRIASWAVVIWDGNRFQHLASGVVSGWRQTSLRGELTAAISALKFCTGQTRPCRLWFDNENVQVTLQQWINGFEVPWQHKQDSDLWFQLDSQFRHAKDILSAANKVQAHACPMHQDTAIDEWAASSVVAPATIPKQIQASHAEPVDAGISLLATKNVEDLPKQLQVDETAYVLEWIRTLVEEEHGVTWVSYHQLLVDYQIQTGRLGPFTNGRKWVAREVDNVYCYPQQVQWMGRFMQNLAKAAGQGLTTDQRRPSSLVLPFWTGCIRVAMDQSRLTEVDSHFKSRFLSEQPPPLSEQLLPMKG
ncbi:unnamed protein product [Cladocopium goreaui]|uniref:RNase H type-1 domain-containing protein n=1 Tax=Cladocopium goreaui TaxID=2562237 RepID=A0A9P1BXC7_9DINO|nr:unnamed protein product [Cladocopium goreaui]